MKNKTKYRLQNPIPNMWELTGSKVPLLNGETIHILYCKKEILEVVDKWFIYYIYRGHYEWMDYKYLKRFFKRPLIDIEN